MNTITVFCSKCQVETQHTCELDSNGEWLLSCQATAAFVRQCTHCLSGAEHVIDDNGVTHHREDEYHTSTVNLPHDESERYTAPCRHFLKLPGHVTDIAPHLDEHKRVNDRTGLPEPVCVHKFSLVADDHRESVCDNCGKTHKEIFSHAD